MNSFVLIALGFVLGFFIYAARPIFYVALIAAAILWAFM